MRVRAVCLALAVGIAALSVGAVTTHASGSLADGPDAAIAPASAVDGLHHAASDFDANATSGSIRWQGQRLYLQSDAADETYVLRESDPATGGRSPGDLVTQLTTDANGSVVFSTSGLEGYYVVLDENGDAVWTNASGVQTGTNATSDGGAVGDSSFEVVVQSLSASFESGTVERGSSVDLNVNSNRGAYTVELTAAGLSSAQINGAFGGTETDAGTAVEVSGTSATLSGDFAGIPTGDYTVDLAVSDTDATASAPISVTESADARANFAPTNLISVRRGDVAAITVEMQSMSRGNVFVGSTDVGYLVNVSVEDADGDGSVTLDANTYLAGGQAGGPESAAWSVGAGDRIADVRRVTGRLSDPLASATYDMNVTSTGGTQLNVGNLQITGRTTDSASVLANPRSQFGNPLADLDLTPSSTVALDDNVVVRVNATGIFGLLAAQGGATATDRFESLINGSAASFNLTQTNPIASEDSKELDRGASFGNDAVHVVPDEANGSMYVVLDESNLRFHSGASAEAAAGDRFEANFTLLPASGLTGDPETVRDEFEMVERRVAWDTAADGRVHVEAAENQTVSGQASVAPGTPLTVELQRTRLPSPFLLTPGTTVESDGSFSVREDFSAVQAGTNFTASVSGYATTADGVVENATSSGSGDGTGGDSGDQTGGGSGNQTNGGSGDDTEIGPGNQTGGPPPAVESPEIAGDEPTAGASEVTVRAGGDQVQVEQTTVQSGGRVGSVVSGGNGDPSGPSQTFLEAVEARGGPVSVVEVAVRGGGDGSPGPAATIEIGTAAGSRVVVVDAAQSGDGSAGGGTANAPGADGGPTVEFVGRGNVVVRGEGTFRGIDETGGAGPPDADNVLGDGSDQTLFFGPGDDVIRGAGGDDLVTSAGGDDELYGNAGDDRVGASAGANALYGGPGDDVLESGAGDDLLVGGPGTDTAEFEAPRERVLLYRTADGTVRATHGGQTDVLRSIERVGFADGEAASLARSGVLHEPLSSIGATPDVVEVAGVNGAAAAFEDTATVRRVAVQGEPEGAVLVAELTAPSRSVAAGVADAVSEDTGLRVTGPAVAVVEVAAAEAVADRTPATITLSVPAPPGNLQVVALTGDGWERVETERSADGETASYTATVDSLGPLALVETAPTRETSDETTASPTATEPSPTADDAVTPTAPGATGPGFGVTAAVLALWGVAVVALRRRL